MPELVDQWPEYALTEPSAVVDAYSEMSDRMRQALEYLAARPLEEFMYDELEGALGWEPRTFHGEFGRWRSRTGAGSLRPFHLRVADPARKRLYIWLDEEQAAAVRSAGG